MEHSNPENIWFTIFSSCLFMFVLLEACAFGSISICACACMSVLIYSKYKLFSERTLFIFRWKNAILHRSLAQNLSLTQSAIMDWTKVWKQCSPNTESVQAWIGPLQGKLWIIKKDPSFAASLNPPLYIKQMSFLWYAKCRLRNCISWWHPRVTLL